MEAKGNDDKFVKVLSVVPQDGVFTIFSGKNMLIDELEEDEANEIAKRWNAYDQLKAKADSHDGLVSALETAKGMLDHIGCVNNNCKSGVIETFHMGEPQQEQCQWCYETDSIKAALDAAKEIKC